MVSASERAEKTEAQKKLHRAQQAAIVAGLQTTLEPNEQLLAFARGAITGGWRGKFAIGLEAFFAPDVNVGLTERRFIMQHIHATTGAASDILPHKFPLEEIAAITFGDIETFGGEPAGRLVMRLQDEQHFRVKLAGALNCADAASMAEVFRSLTNARRKSGLTPTQSVCPHCAHVLDRPTKFCPYCGKTTTPDAEDADFHAEIIPSALNEPTPSTETAEVSASDFADPPFETSPFIAFVAPDFSEAEASASHAETGDAAEPIAEPAFEPAPEIEETGFILQDEAGEDLLPEIPVTLPHNEPTLEMPAVSTDNLPHIACEDAGAPTSEQAHNSKDDAAPTMNETGESIQNPKSKIQKDSGPSPASAAFWREFARISGVATPEVLAQNAEAHAAKTGNPGEKLPEAETETPAFPLNQEEN